MLINSIKNANRNVHLITQSWGKSSRYLLLLKDEQTFPTSRENKAACWDWLVAAERQILFLTFMELSDEGKFIYFATYVA